MFYEVFPLFYCHTQTGASKAPLHLNRTKGADMATVVLLVMICAFVALSIVALATVAIGIALGINAHVIKSTRERILSPGRAGEANADCILVLGCRPQPDGTPSHMLEDRLRRAVELFQAEAAPSILISGHDGTSPRGGRNEVDPMLRYLFNAGIPEERILIDRESFSTFDNINRAKTAFGMTRPLVITQEYHLFRALMIAQKLGMETYGVASDYRRYKKPVKRHVREILARCKDFLKLPNA